MIERPSKPPPARLTHTKCHTIIQSKFGIAIVLINSEETPSHGNAETNAGGGLGETIGRGIFQKSSENEMPGCVCVCADAERVQ